jgi:thymidylate synthase
MLQERVPVTCTPRLVFKTENVDIDGYKPADFEVEGYECNPFLKLPIAV